MPIKPENKNRYPRNWKEIRESILKRADNKCEGALSYPDCRAENYREHPITGSKVILTIAHMDHQPENCSLDNLRALCQRCHLDYDKDFHARNRSLKIYKSRSGA